jgi:hypothetical protein
MERRERHNCSSHDPEASVLTACPFPTWAATQIWDGPSAEPVPWQHRSQPETEATTWPGRFALPAHRSHSSWPSQTRLHATRSRCEGIACQGSPLISVVKRRAPETVRAELARISRYRSYQFRTPEPFLKSPPSDSMRMLSVRGYTHILCIIRNKKTEDSRWRRAACPRYSGSK